MPNKRGNKKGSVRYTKETFLAKLKIKHPELDYDYSKFQYRGCRKLEPIYCQKHGEFEQKPYLLMQGFGCQKCAKEDEMLPLAEIIHRLSSNNVELIDPYIFGIDVVDSDKKCKCKICDWAWYPRIASIISPSVESACPNCAENVPLTKQVVVQRLFDKHIELLEDFVDGVDNAMSPKKGKCLICDYGSDGEWLLYLNTLANSNHKRACPNCIEKAHLSNKIVDQRLVARDLKIKRLGECIDGSTPIDWLCLTCNKPWTTSPSSIFHQKHGCPRCGLRKNQRIMFELLEQFDADFQSEYSLTKIIKSARPKYRFDTYSPKYRIAIEYDGKQHFGPFKIHGKMSDEQTIEEYRLIQERDIYKNNFCVEQDIFIIRIDGREYKDEDLKQHMRNIIIPIIKEKISERSTIQREQVL
jgi:hypothetical protein